MAHYRRYDYYGDDQGDQIYVEKIITIPKDPVI